MFATLLATGFVEKFLNDPLDYLWKGILVIFVVGFLIRFAIEQISGDGI
jgi:hypothetical protein